jgi:hypothetical protein
MEQPEDYRKPTPSDRLRFSDAEFCKHQFPRTLCKVCSAQETMETFLLCQQRDPALKLVKDLNRTTISDLVFEKRRDVFVTRFRPAADGEVGYDIDDLSGDFKFWGLVLASKPLEGQVCDKSLIPGSMTINESGQEVANTQQYRNDPVEDYPIFEVTFEGSREAFIGFLCAWLMKYGDSSIIPFLDTLDPTNPNEGIFRISDDLQICIDVSSRFRWGGEMDHCIFERDPLVTGVLSQFSTDGENDQFFAMHNSEEFMGGFKKAHELLIGCVYPIVPPKVSVIARNSHTIEECESCADAPDEELTDFSVAELPTKAECVAFWRII